MPWAMLSHQALTTPGPVWLAKTITGWLAKH
jgi:hypothetical protein